MSNFDPQRLYSKRYKHTRKGQIIQQKGVLNDNPWPPDYIPKAISFLQSYGYDLTVKKTTNIYAEVPFSLNSGVYQSSLAIKAGDLVNSATNIPDQLDPSRIQSWDLFIKILTVRISLDGTQGADYTTNLVLFSDTTMESYVSLTFINQIDPGISAWLNVASGQADDRPCSMIEQDDNGLTFSFNYNNNNKIKSQRLLTNVGDPFPYQSVFTVLNLTAEDWQTFWTSSSGTGPTIVAATNNADNATLRLVGAITYSVNYIQ